MQKGKVYYNIWFPVAVIEQAINVFLSKLSTPERLPQDMASSASVSIGEETWSDLTTDELLADYDKCRGFYFDYLAKGADKRLIISGDIYRDGNERQLHRVDVKVRFPTRGDIEAVFRVFEQHRAASTIAVPTNGNKQAPLLKVFIGHGHSSQWRDLKDHLQDQHGIKVVAYEIGPRAGLTVKEVLEEMLDESSFALLVLTAEDMDADGEMHARENVIHEVGLFQGSLGFRRAIVLLERGCKEFSNINGLNQIRFSKDNIRETFGDVLATIKREFEEDED